MRPRPVINIDADLDNADWTKKSWDLTGIDTVEQLRAYLEGQGITVGAFKRLPIYKQHLRRKPWLKEL